MAMGAAAVGVLALVPAQRAHAQTTGEQITDYEVTLTLRHDGSMVEHEVITYDFGATPRHGIYRDVLTSAQYDAKHTRHFRVSNIEVSASAGTPASFSTSTNDSYQRIKIGDPNQTITGIHTYTISYTVRGAATTFADHQELYWNAIGTQWPVPVNAAHVVVHAPAKITAAACYMGPAGSGLACSVAKASGNNATFLQNDLASYEGLTVVVAVPPGTMAPDPQPILTKQRDLGDAFAARPDTIGPFALLTVLGVGLVGFVVWRRGRDRRYTGSAVDAALGNTTGADEPVPLGQEDPGPVEFAPPDGIRPGEVGTLVDEHANLVDITATIVDLAVRGWLTITEVADNDYELAATQNVGKGTLLAYETTVMNALFGAGPSVRLSSLKYEFRDEVATIEDALYDDAVTQGWYRIRPDRVRQRWSAIGIGVIVLGIVVTFVTGVVSSYAIVPLAIIVAGIALLLFAHRMPARTGRGTAMFSRVRGFRRLFVGEGEQGVREHFAEQHNIFSQYLPYAIVFGCTDRWAKVFSTLDAQALGDVTWYRGTQPLSALYLASALNSFSTTASGTLYASMPSAGVGSGFGSGFGGGFGGGGFSGGGGGGGGGGSW
jgi:uncharacterized membrane protein